jgi:hypothetical protein
MKRYTSRPIIPVLVELRPSQTVIGEVGVYAVRRLPKDQIIAEAAKFDEKFVAWSEFKKLDLATQSKVKRFCNLTPEGYFAPPDFNQLTIAFYLNHSCSYSVGFNDLGDFITTRPIAKGEELFLDYGMLISYPKYRMTCKGGSPDCRKIITGNDWKNPLFVAKNKKYMLRELLQKGGCRNCYTASGEM